MHQALAHLSKRIAAAHKVALDVLNEVEQQVEKEGKRLEEVSGGKRFDEEQAEVQSRLVAGLQEAMSMLEEAEGSLGEAVERVEELQRE
jgi:hypothetical protein